MPTGWSFFGDLLIVLAAFAGVCWLLWQWLKRTTEPVDLMVRWAITLVLMLGVLGFAARAHDEISKVAGVILGGIGGLILTLIWRQRFCDWVGDMFASLYTGGKEEVDPAPFYSIAQGRRKQGRYLEAIAEVQKQLERFPNDFTGWMLLAEIQAEDLKNVAEAHETVEQLLSQPDHAPKNIAFALNREADWQLKLCNDREAARAALERIVEILPDSEQAQLALQRIAHLAPSEMLAEKREPRRIKLEAGIDNIGLQTEPVGLAPAMDDPATAAGRLVKQLEEHPYDVEARERLALLYSQHYRRLDMASDQLEQLIAFPNQPAKLVVHWLNLLADLQVEHTGDLGLVRQTLQRIVDLYPKSAAAENALNRMAYLKLELRPKQQSQAIKLGSYEQNIGLKGPGGAG